MLSPCSHLARLEAESIHILREAVAESERPVMLFSAGKDSTVMAHLALRAFFPGTPPFPLLHVDSTWEFRDLTEFRDAFAREHGFELIVYANEQGRALGFNPFEHGDRYTMVMRTDALKAALDQGAYDVVFGGARRDEEKSRAKERIVSIRNPGHVWDPRQQRPEFWREYNLRLSKGQSARVFPPSNWTEHDVIEYALLREITLAPLYFAALSRRCRTERRLYRCRRRPERVADEYRRRIAQAADGANAPEEITRLDKQMSALRRGIGRLNDGYAAGFVEKDEFEPRVTGMKQRLSHLQERHEVAVRAAESERDLCLIISRLEDFTAKASEGLSKLDRSGQREIIRALVRRIEVDGAAIEILFRVPPPTAPYDPAPPQGPPGNGQQCTAVRRTNLRRDDALAAPRAGLRETHRRLQSHDPRRNGRRSPAKDRPLTAFSNGL